MATTLQASFGLDLTPLRASAKEAMAIGDRVGRGVQRSLSGINFASLTSSLGGFTALLTGGGVAAGLKGITAYAGDLTDMASAINLNTDAFQRYSFAFEQAGGSQQAFQKGMAALLQQMEAAKDGNEKSIATFQKLGITWDELHRLSPDQVLLKLADALHASGNDGATTADVMSLLGERVALKLIPALQGGSEAFLALGRDAKVMSAESIKAFDDMGDSLDKFVKNYKSTIASGLGVIISEFQEKGWRAGGKQSVGPATPAEMEAARKRAAEGKKRLAAQQATPPPPPAKPAFDPDSGGGSSNRAPRYEYPRFHSGSSAYRAPRDEEPEAYARDTGEMHGPAIPPQMNALARLRAQGTDLDFRGVRHFAAPGSGGLGGGAHSLVRRGDAGRAKEQKGTPEEETAKNTAAIVTELRNWNGR